MHDEISGDGMIRGGECLEELQPGNLRILQKKAGFRFGMDAVLLADFADVRKQDTVADFGTGTGILPLLLYSRKKGDSFDGIEIQPEMADMARRTMQLNGLQETIRVHEAGAADAEQLLGYGTVDHIVCNPPYGQPGATRKNPDVQQSAARHQENDGLEAWFRTAYTVLKGKGKISLIYPAAGMLSIMRQLSEHHLEPKRFRLVYPGAEKPAKLVLVEAVKDARPTLKPMPPLIICRPDGSPTDEMRRIYREDAAESYQT